MFTNSRLKNIERNYEELESRYEKLKDKFDKLFYNVNISYHNCQDAIDMMKNYGFINTDGSIEKVQERMEEVRIIRNILAKWEKEKLI